MKENFKSALFQKHILVSDAGENQVEVIYALLKELNIQVTAGFKYANISLLKFAEKQLGTSVPAPFYAGFPQSVRELTTNELLLDQLIHYTQTYGFGNFGEVGHSLFEQVKERAHFDETILPYQEFVIVTEAEAVQKLFELVDSLLNSTRPLNSYQLVLIREVMQDYRYEPKAIASKQTACDLLLFTRNIAFVKFLQLHDVIKFVDTLNWKEYHKEKLNKLRLNNRDRKFITRILDSILERERTSYSELQECAEKQKTWKGLLHLLHYVGKNANGKATVSALFNDNIHSAYSGFEKRMRIDPVDAGRFLKERKGNGALIRNLNYILSRADKLPDPAHRDWCASVVDQVEGANPIALLQLQASYRNYNPAPRVFAYTQHEYVRRHYEVERPYTLSEDVRKTVVDRLEKKLEQALKGKAGKVYIAPGMENIAVPLNMSASESGFGIMPTGTRLDLPDSKKIRAFTYWEKVNDIDLSCFGLNKDGSTTEFSWRTMLRNQSDALTFSGDETSGYNGGSEYYDVDIDKIMEMHPNMQYMVFCNNVYSGIDFSECVCKAGFMARDIEDSGEIFEPKTVQTSFTIDAKTTFAYLFAIDLINRQVIWLNVADAERARVAGTTCFEWLDKYFHLTDVMNIRKLFTYAATEVVSRPEEADLVVGDVTTDKPCIKSYEFEKALKYLA